MQKRNMTILNCERYDLFSRLTSRREISEASYYAQYPFYRFRKEQTDRTNDVIYSGPFSTCYVLHLKNINNSISNIARDVV